MPIFTFTVGSIGDFLALGGLIIKLGVVLYKPGEATKDYEELRRELELLCQALGKIKICKGQKKSPIAEGCLKAVHVQVAACQKIIEEFLERRSPPRESVWNKITWATKGANEAAELRQRLSTHRETISLLLEILLSQQLSDVMAICETGVKDIQTIVKHQTAQLTLVDAIGNYRQMPFDFCFTYEMFTEVLNTYYKHQKLPGYEYVTRGDYQMVLGSDLQVVNPLQWRSSVKPDSILQMSMVLRRPTENGSKCPRCNAVFKGQTVNDWANCSECDAQFRITLEPKEENDITSPARAADTSSSDHALEVDFHRLSLNSENSGQELMGLSDEWRMFRLLSIIGSAAASHDKTSEEQSHLLEGDMLSKLIRNVEKDSSSALNWYLIGRAYMETRKYNKAHEAYQQAVYRDGRDPVKWISIGILYYRVNQFRDAIDAYSRAIRLDPYIYTAWLNLGILYEVHSGQIVDARDLYTRAHELNPENQAVKEQIDVISKHMQDPTIVLSRTPLVEEEVHPLSFYQVS